MGYGYGASVGSTTPKHKYTFRPKALQYYTSFSITNFKIMGTPYIVWK